MKKKNHTETEEAAADTVKVVALQLHTLHGQTHDEGEIYDVDPALVDTLIAQGKARRAD